MQTKVIQNQSDPAAPAPSVQDTVIHTVGLTKTFGHVNALQGIDLTVPRNSIVGFLGPNGSGKTTAIKLLLGLSRPTAGKATLFGMDSVQDSIWERRTVRQLRTTETKPAIPALPISGSSSEMRGERA